MRAEDVVLIQLELAKREHTWFIQVTYYDNEGDEARVDNSVPMVRPRLQSWNSYLAWEIMSGLLDLAGDAKPYPY